MGLISKLCKCCGLLRKRRPRPPRNIWGTAAGWLRLGRENRKLTTGFVWKRHSWGRRWGGGDEEMIGIARLFPTAALVSLLLVSRCGRGADLGPCREVQA